MKSTVMLGALFSGVLFVDQVSKYFVDRTLELNESLPVIENYFYLRYIRNPGIAFGLKFGHPFVMLTVTTIIILLLGWLFLKGRLASGNILEKTAMVLVLGGAVGNHIDRIRMREVIDFIDMGIGRYRWPVYNLADTFVTIGMGILVAAIVFTDKKPEQTNHAPSSLS